MFTGIIEELGEVKSLSRRGNFTLLEISTQPGSSIAPDVEIGDSIAVCGACLTLTGRKAGSLFFQAMPETLKATTLGSLRIGEKVNLERALKAGDRLSGHFVTGHVDCPGIIRSKRHSGGNLAFEIAVPVKYMKNIIARGSVAIDGISLTVMEKRPGSFAVYIIPHTYEHTTLKFKGPSDKVNVEFDILTKKV